MGRFFTALVIVAVLACLAVVLVTVIRSGNDEKKDDGKK